MASKMLVVPATLYWTNPHRKDKYGFVSGTFGNLEADTVKSLKEAGLKVRFDADNDANEPDHQGFFLKARSDTPVPCKDSEGNPMPDNMFLGNGTKALVAIEAKEWVSKEHGTSGVKALLRGIKVTELVPYDPDAAAKAKAEAMLDETSGGEGGFVFGGSDDDTVAAETDGAESDEKFNELFGDE